MWANVSVSLSYQSSTSVPIGGSHPRRSRRQRADKIMAVDWGAKPQRKYSREGVLGYDAWSSVLAFFTDYRSILYSVQNETQKPVFVA